MQLSLKNLTLISGCLLTVIANTGCRHEMADGSETEAIVSLSQYQRAYTIVKGVDYLPFVVTRDGCYARALFMAMELAAEKIQSSSTFALAAPGTTLRLADGTVWRYHVAPMLQVPGYSPAILDPSMNANPMAQSAWVNTMQGQGATVYSIPGPYYGYWYASQAYSTNIISSFDEMPSFRVEDIQHACQTANMFIGEDNSITEAQKSAKRAKLADRAVYLGRKMSEVGKLTNGQNIRAYNCQLAPSY